MRPHDADVAKTSARHRGRASRTPEIDEPPPPPTLGMRLAGVPRPTWLFSLLAILSTILTVQSASAAGISDSFTFSTTVLRGIPTAVAFLIPAALFLRHRDAWTTDRVLVVGTVLFGVVELLQYASPGVTAWLDTIIPPDPTSLLPSPLNVSFTVIVGLLGALAPAVTGRGLLAARAYEDSRRSRVWWLIVALLTLIAGVTNILLLINLSLDIPNDTVVIYFWLTVLTVVVSLINVFGWAYLAGVALVGWRSYEEPGTGWGIGALGSGVVLAGLAASGVVAAISVFGPKLPDQSSLAFLGAFALGYLLLIVAFFAGLPAAIDE